MQSLENTFRIVQKALRPFGESVRYCADRFEQGERLTVSPFENPCRSFGLGPRPGADKSAD